MGNFHIFQEHIVLSSDANVTSPKSLILLCHHEILVNYFSSTDEKQPKMYIYDGGSSYY